MNADSSKFQVMIYAPGHEKESNEWEKAHIHKIFTYEFAQRSCLSLQVMLTNQVKLLGRDLVTFMIDTFENRKLGCNNPNKALATYSLLR